MATSFKALRILHKKKDVGEDLPTFDPALANQGLYVKFKNVINDPLVKKLVSFGSETFSAIQPFAEKPSVWTALKASFLIGKAAVDYMEIWAHDFFDEDGIWIEPFPKDFTGAILKVLKKFPYETLKTAQEGSSIHLVTMPEGRLGWVTNTKVTTYKVDRIYAEATKVFEIRERIEKLLWEQFEGKPLVLRRNITSLRALDEDRIVLEVDDAFHPLPSKLATQYTKYLKRAIDGGVNRSVMLYGPPGTGKSTMARTLVDDLGLRSFRIRIEDVGGLDNSTMFEAINIFKPDAIILDDFDRAHGQEQLLETLEHFQRNVKLVIATVNHRKNLDEALLRPGRFDELILVKRMDDKVIKNVLGPENEELFERVKEWPIAFIQEFVKRRRFMSKKEAMKSIQELAERVERLGSFEEDDELVRVMRKVPPPADHKIDLNRRRKEPKIVIDEETDEVHLIENDDDKR